MWLIKERASEAIPSALDLTSKRAIALYPIRVHQRVSAVQKCDRPYVKKSDWPFPIRVHQRVSAVQKCVLPRHKYSTIPTISSDV